MSEPIQPFSFATAKRVHFAAGGAGELAAISGSLAGTRQMVVTDAGLVATGIVTRVVDALKAAGVEVDIYSEIEADPSETTVLAAAARCKSAGVQGVIGLGGGSSLDVSKLVAYLACNDVAMADIYGIGNATGTRLPLILIPTTAGTGSEVTPIAIVTTGTHEKMGVVAPVLLPDLAVLDPELTVGLPAHITAATGIDAMVHAIEAHASASSNNNPVSRALAIQGLQLMGGALLRAVQTGSDIAARSDLLLGSMLAGQAFGNSPVAAVHALAYPIGGHFGVPHGLSNALVLPHVLAFNAATAPQAYAETAVAAFPELAGLPVPERAAAFGAALAKLSHDCGLPQRLRDVGVARDDLPMMTRDAMKQTRLLVNNPRAVTETDVHAIYEAAW